MKRATRESANGGNPDELPEAKRKGPKRFVIDPKEETVEVVGLTAACIGGIQTINPGETAMLPKSLAANLAAGDDPCLRLVNAGPAKKASMPAKIPVKQSGE